MRMILALVFAMVFAGVLQAQEITHTTEIRVIHTVRAVYTKDAFDAKLEGTVVVSVVVGVDGVPSDVKLVRGLGMGLDEHAENAVRQWRFKPATKHGEPIARKATIEVGFRLSDPTQTPGNSK